MWNITPESKEAWLNIYADTYENRENYFGFFERAIDIFLLHKPH